MCTVSITSGGQDAKLDGLGDEGESGGHQPCGSQDEVQGEGAKESGVFTETHREEDEYIQRCYQGREQLCSLGGE